MDRDETLPDQLRRELGLVVEQFNRLEWAIGRCVHMLLRGPARDVDIVLAELSFRSLLNVLNALMRRHRPDVDVGEFLFAGS